MTKIKDIRTKRTRKKARITVKSLIADVRKKISKEKVEAVMNMLEDKYREFDSAKRVMKKIERQIKSIENKDIEEIDLDDYQYEEDEE